MNTPMKPLKEFLRERIEECNSSRLEAYRGTEYSTNNFPVFEEIIRQYCELYLQAVREEAQVKLAAELKDGDESLCAKLRNALSPHYGLPSVISKLRKHPEILSIAEDMSEQAVKSNLRIDILLNSIDSQLEEKSKEIEELKYAWNIDIDVFNSYKGKVKSLSSELQEAKAEVERTAIGFFEWMETNGWLTIDNTNKLYAQMSDEPPFDYAENGKLIRKENYEMFKEPHKTLQDLYATYKSQLHTKHETK